MAKTNSDTIKKMKKDLKEGITDSWIKRVPRTFKMSDFEFPPVKRVNTRLARKTLQTDLGVDVLKDIINLDIDIKIK